MAYRSSISWADSAAVGSSMMTTLESWDSARAISTMCFWATLSSLSGVSGRMSDSRLAISSAARARIRGQSSRSLPRRRKWPEKMFSATLSSSNMTVSWCTAVIPCFQASWVVRNSAGWPATRSWPPSG